MKLIHPLIAVLLLLPALALAETGTVLKDDALRAEPFADARSTGNLKRNDAVEILEKKGAWLRVKSGKQSGWVLLLSVRRGSATQGNEAAGVLGLASGRAGTGQVVSTTGVRGLSAEELKAASFNEAEVQKMESYSVSADQARQVAGDGGLKNRKLDDLGAGANKP